MPQSARARIWLALVTVYVVWGSTYLAIRVVVHANVPPFIGMGLRFVAAGLLLFTIVAATRGVGLLRVTRSELVSTAVMGATLLLGGNALVAVAEKTLPSGLAALMVGAVPLWFALLQCGGGARPTRLVWCGVIVGFAGIAAISLPRGGIAGVKFWGVATILIASISWSIGSYVAPRLRLPRNPMVATTYEMLTGGTMILVAAELTGETKGFSFRSMPHSAVWALLYLVIVGSLLGYTAYVYLLANAPLSLVGTYAYVNPVVAVFLGWIILHERVTPVVFLGGALVVAGVAMVVRGERPKGNELGVVQPSPAATSSEDSSVSR